MIIAYVSHEDKGCYTELENEFEDVRQLSSIDEFINFYARSKNRYITITTAFFNNGLRLENQIFNDRRISLTFI